MPPVSHNRIYYGLSLIWPCHAAWLGRIHSIHMTLVSLRCCLFGSVHFFSCPNCSYWLAWVLCAGDCNDSLNNQRPRTACAVIGTGNGYDWCPATLCRIGWRCQTSPFNFIKSSFKCITLKFARTRQLAMNFWQTARSWGNSVCICHPSLIEAL